MQIAILADIHGNEPALRAVMADLDSRKPDVVLVGGDIINRGPHPRACFELIAARQQHDGWGVIRGNHEDYVLSEMNPPLDRPAWLEQLCGHSAWTCKKMTDHLAAIAKLPHQLDVAGPGATQVRCVHASMAGNRVGLHETMDDDEMHELAGTEPDVLCVGHTHVPFIRRLNLRMVFNVGSAGMPFDGDPRASYGWLQWRQNHWHAEIIRLDYDRAAQTSNFETSGYLRDAGPLAPLIFEEFKRSRPLVSRWHREYEAIVARGDREIGETVRELIAALPPVPAPK